MDYVCLTALELHIYMYLASLLGSVFYIYIFQAGLELSETRLILPREHFG